LSEDAPTQANGLIAWWSMEKIEGSVIQDKIGDHDLVIPPIKKRVDVVTKQPIENFIPELKRGILGQALSLSRKQQGYLSVKNAMSLSKQIPLTVMAWIKPVRTNAKMDIITCMADSPDADSGWRLKYAWSQAAFDLVVSNGKHITVSTEKNLALQANQWHHLAAVVTSDEICLYVNGNLAASEKLLETPAKVKLPLIIANAPHLMD
jgi:hypothetical protein